MKNISVVITSCGRFDLLERTIFSFLKYNTYKNINQIIVIDDSGFVSPEESIKNIFSKCLLACEPQIIINTFNIGQVASIDKAYENVINEYIFHLEDDWEFYDYGFIEESLQILENYKEIMIVWLRNHNDTNRHPLENLNNYEFKLPKLNCGNWHGFTWNPGLRRLSDYNLIKPFYKNANSEEKASIFYMKNGFRSAISKKENGYVKHIGYNGRSTAFMKDTKKG
jgi:GT2 family glycosyltransferase